MLGDDFFYAADAVIIGRMRYEWLISLEKASSTTDDLYLPI